jgi:hypothetical protein
MILYFGYLLEPVLGWNRLEAEPGRYIKGSETRCEPILGSDLYCNWNWTHGSKMILEPKPDWNIEKKLVFSLGLGVLLLNIFTFYKF